MFDEPNRPKPEELVELLEELTLSTAPEDEARSALSDERLSVDLRGHVSIADRSRQQGRDAVALRLVRVGPREFSVELQEPLLVGDHYAVAFAADEFAFASAEHATMRCTACAETDSGAFRATLRPFVDIDLRRALSGEQPGP